MEKIEAKLSERQSLALTEIREQWKKTLKGITAKDLNETYPNEWDHQNKALNTLNQLEKKACVIRSKLICQSWEMFVSLNHLFRLFRLFRIYLR